MSTQTYKGSCHCGAVRFEVDLDLTTSSNKCNCSICLKTRNWSMIVKPAAFRLLQGDADLGDYSFGSHSAHHKFCKRCGVSVFGTGYIEQIGGEYCSIKVSCLDDVSPETLAAIPVQHMDGRNNNWFERPSVTSHL